MAYKGILQISELRLVARPYLQITTIALLVLGLAGGWAGSNWPTVLISYLLMMSSIIWIGRQAKMHGPGPLQVYASALINLAATTVIVIITGGAQSPFWLLFLIGAITSAMSFQPKAGITLEVLNIGVASVTLLGSELLNGAPQRPLVALAGMEISILLLSSLMIRRITSLILSGSEAVKESEERYRKLVEHARDVIFTISTDGKITSLNPAFETFMGWPRTTWLGRPFDELIHESDRGRAQDQFERILRGETVRALRLQMHTHSGEILVVEMNISPQYKDDQVIGLLGIARDMTQEQRAEDALRASERRFRSLIENSYDSIALGNAEGIVTYVSPSTQRIMGYAPEELVGHLGIEHVHPEDQAFLVQQLVEILQHPEKTVVVQYRAQHKDNSWRWIEAVVRNRLMDPDVKALVGNYRDVTERKLAEEMLQKREADLGRAQAIAHLGSYLWDIQTGAVEWSHEVFEIWGLRGPGISFENVISLIHPEDRERVLEAGRRAREDNADFNVEYRIVRPDASIRYVHDRAEITHGADGSPIRMFGTIQDITERKQVEEKLQHQNLRLKVLREIDTAILAADSVENIVGAALDHVLELIECQRASMAIFDWKTKEMLVFSVRASRQTSIQKGTRAPLERFQRIIQTLSESKPAVIHDMASVPDLQHLYQPLINDGLHSMCALPLFSQSILIGSFTMYSETPGFFDEEQINLGREVANQVAIAITQNRLLSALEQNLHEREILITDLTAKNAELERFIYTVSHELKSPLVTMKGYLGYLEQNAIHGNMERLREDVQRISNAVEKMKELLNDLLELSRIGRLMSPPKKVPFDDVVRDALEIVRGQLEAQGVTVHTQSQLPVVYGDRQRLIEVLQNLLDNAAKYRSEESNPLIEIGQQGEVEGNLLFFVRDNGIGIAPEYHERIFGLFNKLNPQSEGTGIGLALVKRIIEFHGGRIWVESDGVPGKGATFYFTLPRG